MPRYLILAHDPLIAAEGVRKRIPAGIDCERYYVADLSLDEIWGQLASQDLFAEQKCLHYLNPIELKPIKSERERLAEAIAKIPDSTTLIVSQLIKADTKKREQAILKGNDLKLWAEGAIVDDLLAASEGAQALQWLANRASETHDININQQQLARILELSGGEVVLADSELAKLALLAGGDSQQPVSDAAIAEVVSSNPQARFYQLVDSILNGSPAAITSFNEWLQQDAELWRLFNELKRRLLGLLALSQGESVQPPYFARQLSDCKRHWQGGKLARAIRQVAQLETDLKTGKLAGVNTATAEEQAISVLIQDIALLAQR